MKLMGFVKRISAISAVCNVLHYRTGRCLLLLAVLTVPVSAADDVLSFIDASLQSTPNSLVVSPDGANVYITSLLNGLVSYTRDSVTGGLINKNIYVNDDAKGIVGLNEPWRVMVSPDGFSVYVLSRGGDAVTLFQRNNASDRLEFVDSYQNGSSTIQSMLSPAGLVISPDGQYVYVACSGRNGEPGAVVTFLRNAEGRLVFLEALTDGINDLEGLASAQDLVITPDGKNVYVASSNDTGLVQFSRDTETGRLYFIPSNVSITGVIGGQAIAVSPNGKQVYITRDTTNSLILLNRNTINGQLIKAEEYADINNSRSNNFLGVVVAPGGSHVMLSTYDIFPGNSSGAVSVYRRNPLDGTLSLAGRHSHQSGVIDGLDNVSAMAFTPDGGQMFTSSIDVSPGPDENNAVGRYSILGVDLSVVSIPDVSFVNVGSSFRLMLTISNDGVENASGVALTSRIPDGVGVVDVTSDTGECSIVAGIIRCELGNLDAGITTSVYMTLAATSTGSFDGEVTVFSNQRDYNTANNRDIGSIVVESDVVSTDNSSSGGGAYGWMSIFLLTGISFWRRLKYRCRAWTPVLVKLLDTGLRRCGVNISPDCYGVVYKRPRQIQESASTQIFAHSLLFYSKYINDDHQLFDHYMKLSDTINDFYYR